MELDIGNHYMAIVVDEDVRLGERNEMGSVSCIRIYDEVDHTGWMAPCTTL
jgi:hypothetical protein